MRKETVTYEDFDGESRTEDFYFNLTKAEITELGIAIDGDLEVEKAIKTLISSKDNKQIVAIFKDIVIHAYGEQQLIGGKRRFIKNQELRDAFASTNAYSEIFMKLASDAEYGAKFINDVIPQGLVTA